MSSWHDSRPARTPGMSAKQEILARVRSALATPRTDPVTEAEDVPRTYQRADSAQEQRATGEKTRNTLVRRLEDCTAIVHRTTAAGAPAAIAAALREARGVIVPDALPEDWTAQIAPETVIDDGSASPRELDRFDAVLTGCHTAIASTGTLVLRADGRGGRRALTLVPDHHVVVVEPDQVVLGVPKGVERMAEDPRAAWTMIAGPSATSDIELDRVEGMHGPRRLEVVLIEPEPAPAAPASPESTTAHQETPTP